MKEDYQQLAEENGVCLARFSSEHWAPYYVVCDTACEHYRLTFSAHAGTGLFSVGIGAEWSDENPGVLASYASNVLSLDDDVTITDSGLLKALARRQSANSVDIRAGFVAQLPSEYVGMVRRALAIVREETKSLGESA